MNWNGLLRESSTLLAGARGKLSDPGRDPTHLHGAGTVRAVAVAPAGVLRASGTHRVGRWSSLRWHWLTSLKDTPNARSTAEDGTALGTAYFTHHLIQVPESVLKLTTEVPVRSCRMIVSQDVIHNSSLYFHFKFLSQNVYQLRPMIANTYPGSFGTSAWLLPGCTPRSWFWCSISFARAKMGLFCYGAVIYDCSAEENTVSTRAAEAWRISSTGN